MTANYIVDTTRKCDVMGVRIVGKRGKDDGRRNFMCGCEAVSAANYVCTCTENVLLPASTSPDTVRCSDCSSGKHKFR